MELYAGDRKSGKTTTLLRRAAETGIPILVKDIKMKTYMYDFAKRIGEPDIKFITLREQQAQPEKKILVDEAHWILSILLETEIVGMTVTASDRVDLGPTKEIEE